MTHPWFPELDESRPPAAERRSGTPFWAWIFAVLCGAIPIIALGGVIPCVIGIGGASACLGLGRRQRNCPLLGVLSCFGITLVCWVGFGALLLVIFVARGGQPLPAIRRLAGLDPQPIQRAPGVPQPIPRGRQPARVVAPKLPFHAAVANDDPAEVRRWLAKNPDPDKVLEQGKTPLRLAVESRRLAIIELLLEHGANPNSAVHGHPPLVLAVQRRDLPLAELLLEHAANPNAGKIENQSLLGFACERQFWDLADLLAGRGGRFINPKPDHFQRALQNNRVTVLTALLDSDYTIGDADLRLIERAIHQGQTQAIATCLAHGLSPDARSASSPPLVHVAISAGRPEILQLLLEHKADPDACDRGGLPALSLAAMNRNAVAAQLLLDHGATADKPDSQGKTPLHYATTAEDLPTLSLLLKHGATVDLADRTGSTSLALALARTNKAIFPLLLEHTQDIDRRNARGQTLLHLAARRGDRQVMEALITKGADINAVDQSKQTPLLTALGEDLDAANWLAEHNAALFRDPVPDLQGRSAKLSIALGAAAQAGHAALARAILDSGLPVDSTDRRLRETALHKAARAGRAEIVRLLIERGAKWSAVDSRQETPLFLALCGKHDSVMKLLMDAGADPLKTLPSGMTLLHLAARHDQPDVVKRLIQLGAKLEQTDGGGRTPLYLAVESDAPGSCRALVDAGAEIETGDRGGAPPLDVAVRRGNEEIVKLLLDHGADPDGRYALFDAINHWRGSPTILIALIARGANLEARNGFGETPLGTAARNRRDEAVKLLLAKNVQVDVVDNRKYTPLHWAVATKRLPIIEQLVQAGADLSPTNQKGQTAHEMAVQAGLPQEVADRLRPL